MRSFVATLLFISAAIAQTVNNAISGTPEVTAGQETTIEWTNPTSGTVSIYLQPAGDGSDIRATDGFVVAADVSAQDGTASFTVPADQVADGVEYTLRIVDDANANIYNFSPTFSVAGATGDADALNASGSASASGASVTEIDSASRTGTSTETDSSSTTDESSSTTEASKTESTTSRSTRTSASETASETAAPNSSNGVGSLKVQGGMVAVVAAAVAML